MSTHHDLIESTHVCVPFQVLANEPEGGKGRNERKECTNNPTNLDHVNPVLAYNEVLD
jgi:hypothetical protein